MLIEITDHAYDRMNERCGFSKRAGNRMAKLAYNKGLKHSETSGKIYEYIAHKTEKHTKADHDIRLYGEFVYCFLNTVNAFTLESVALLITVWKIPKTLNKHALGLQQKKKEQE